MAAFDLSTVIGHAVANLKAAHAIAELIDFHDDIISQYGAPHEGRPIPASSLLRHRGPMRILLPAELAAIGG